MALRLHFEGTNRWVIISGGKEGRTDLLEGTTT